MRFDAHEGKRMFNKRLTPAHSGHPRGDGAGLQPAEKKEPRIRRLSGV